MDPDSIKPRPTSVGELIAKRLRAGDSDPNASECHTIFSVNQLAEDEKRTIYSRIIPSEILDRYQLNHDKINDPETRLLQLNCRSGSPVAEMALYHKPGFEDPILYGQITDTINGQIYVMLYIMNDPDSPRFDVDRLPDGTSTRFGTRQRNLEAEEAAMEYGLGPGQIRKGPRLLGTAIQSFEAFVSSLGHEMYFVEPLYYHTAVVFERYGFKYEKGQRTMERIHAGFEPDGNLWDGLDNSTPFRKPKASHSIRLRSWAIHDRLMDEPYGNVSMYKWVGKHAGVNTCRDCPW